MAKPHNTYRVSKYLHFETNWTVSSSDSQIETFSLSQVFFVVLNSNCIDMYETYICTILELKKVVYKYIPCMVELKLFLHFWPLKNAKKV